MGPAPMEEVERMNAVSSERIGARGRTECGDPS